MRRIVFFFSSVLMLAIALPSIAPASAAVKSGTTCKSVGQVVAQGSQQLTCTKVSKKLVWVSKEIVKVPQTSLGSPVAVKAFTEMQKAIDAMGTEGKPNITYIPTPSASSALVSESQRNLIFASEYFRTYLPASRAITAWVVGSPQDSSWYAGSWRVAIPEQAEDLIGRQDYISGQVGSTTDGALALVFTSVEQLTSFHEYTHAVQDEVAQGKSGLLCWVREGMAEYESNAMLGRNSEVVYKAAMLNLVKELSMISTSLFNYRSAGLDYWINFFVSDETRLNGNCRRQSSVMDPAYSVGGLGFQYLEGQYGRDKVFQFIHNIGTDWKGVCPAPQVKQIACKSWKTAFKKAFGIEPAVAYKAMGAFIVNQIAWSYTVQGLNEAAINEQFPQSRSVPEYAPLPTKDVAGGSCNRSGEMTGNLKCVLKGGSMFWSFAGSLNGGSQSGGTQTGGTQTGGTPPPSTIDDLGAPPNVPAPGRSCPYVDDRTHYEKTPLICVKGIPVNKWMIDPNPPTA